VAGERTGQPDRHQRRAAPAPRSGYDQGETSPSPLRLMLFLVLAVLFLSMVPWLGETTGLIGQDTPSAPAPTCVSVTVDDNGVACRPTTR
jgi:hypothetical protein